MVSGGESPKKKVLFECLCVDWGEWVASVLLSTLLSQTKIYSLPGAMLFKEGQGPRCTLNYVVASLRISLLGQSGSRGGLL